MRGRIAISVQPSGVHLTGTAKRSQADRSAVGSAGQGAKKVRSHKKPPQIPDDSLSERPHVDILLDSSFVITLVKQRRDLERELLDAIPKRIKIKILDFVLFELEHLARKSPLATRTSAKSGLEFLIKRGYQVLEHKLGPVDVDASLVALALSEKHPTAIATLDRGLREASRALGITVISPKRVHGLIVEGSAN